MGEEERKDKAPAVIPDVQKNISAVGGIVGAIPGVVAETPKVVAPPASIPPMPYSADKKSSTDDEEILKFLKETEQKILVIGAGGSGTNTLDRLFEMGTQGITTIGMNTDAKHLLKIRANKKIILGKKISGGRGAGSNPLVGEEAAKESLQEIKEAIFGSSMVFITCGLGEEQEPEAHP